MRIGCAIALLAWCVPASHGADPEDAHYNAAVQLYNAGQWQAALAKIDEREKQTIPDAFRPRYLYARGLALEKGGRAADARTAYRRLITTHPTAAETEKARLALVYLDYAERAFEAVLADGASLDAAKLATADRKNLALMRAEAWMAGNKSAEALAAFDQALAAGADRQALAPKLFELYYRAGRHADMLALTLTNAPGLSADRIAAARAEACMALGKAAEALTEAERVPTGSPDYPRACLVKAQVFIRQGKLKDALAPLQTAVDGLRDPPAPPSAYLALAECLLEDGRTNSAAQTLDKGTERAASLPEAERQAFAAQSASLKLRLASELSSGRDLARTVDAVASNLPPEMRVEALYWRAHALHQQNDWEGLMRVWSNDSPALIGSPREGPAVLMAAEALGRCRRGTERRQALEGLIARKPADPDALRARLLLANDALEAGDETGARAHYKAVLGAPTAAAAVGTNAWRDSARNAVALALKTNDPTDAIRIAEPLAGAPSPDGRLLVMLGQAYVLNNQPKQAETAWKRALEAGGTNVDATEIRERLARALWAAGDANGAREYLRAMAASERDEQALSREWRELWARVSFGAGDFTNAAARYTAQADAERDTPAYRYEAAVAYERAGRWADAAQAYARADKAREALPPLYAAAVEWNGARARLEASVGDRGASVWLAHLAPTVSNTLFETAAVFLGRCLAADAKDGVDPAALEHAMDAYAPDQPRRYTCGSLYLQALAARGADRPLAEAAGRLIADYSAHEAALPTGIHGTTLAPAIFYYFRGEAARRTGTPAQALADFETVLSVYPYNEWPDAAAYSAAECYADLGDRATAKAKLTDLIQTAGTNAASAVWRERAQRRLETLTKEDSR